MTSNSTTPIGPSPTLQVQTLVIDVVDGPNAGLRAQADEDTVTVGNAQGNFLRLTDPTVSGYHLELSATKGGVSIRDLGSTNGTLLGDVRLASGVVPHSTHLKLGTTVIRVSDGGQGLVEIHPQDHLGGLVGRSQVMRRLMARIQRVAPAPASVLLIGESGTGKELIARAIHMASNRARRPFITVDCGALAPSLVASELFGHERGAFTGADRRHIGAFERADGGTLFLDEVGELPPELQPQLLGALERRRFRRVGGREEVSVDVRVVCATNRDLREEVNRGSFRADLFFRIAVVLLQLPSLRERPDDLPLLVEHFLREAGEDRPLEQLMPHPVMAQLARHHWPGNVRELRNWVEATVAIGEYAELHHTQPRPTNAAPVAGQVAPDHSRLSYKDARLQVLDAFELRYLGALFEACGGNVSKAARTARMDRSYLIKLLAKHHIK